MSGDFPVSVVEGQDKAMDATSEHSSNCIALDNDDNDDDNDNENDDDNDNISNKGKKNKNSEQAGKENNQAEKENVADTNKSESESNSNAIKCATTDGGNSTDKLTPHDEIVKDDAAEQELSPAQQPSSSQPLQEVSPTHSTTSPPPSVDPSLEQHSMELNVALESLESMRKANLEVEFFTATSALPSSASMPVRHDRCTTCQREALVKLIASPPPPPPTCTAAVMKRDSNSSANDGERRSGRLDGSRIRRFRNRFFSRSATTPSNKDATDATVATDATTGGASSAQSKASASCPPSLESPRTYSTSSLDSEEFSLASTSIDGQQGSSDTTRSNNTRRSRNSIPRRSARPCLTCGHPTCPAHSSSNLGTRHIPMCQQCSYLFELDFIVDCITTASTNEECRRKVNEMVDCYDRARLLLNYTSQYTDDVAQALETRTARSNKIGASSSATGVVSGIAGVVGCGALLFPPVAAAGVPLLIASLVFGGTATAAQTGDAAVQYFSEPNRLADKMVALHGMVLSLLRITEVLSYGLLQNHLDVQDYTDMDGDAPPPPSSSPREALAQEIEQLLEKHGVKTAAGMGALKTAVVGGAIAAEAAVSAEAAALGAASNVASRASLMGRHSRYFGRVGTTAMNGARLIPLAGGVLSAACVMVEGRELKRTLSRIGDGNPCDKAEQLRSIRDELDKFPDSSIIAEECDRVFRLAEQRRLKKAALGKKGSTITLEDVTHGDISNLIDEMELTAMESPPSFIESTQDNEMQNSLNKQD